MVKKSNTMIILTHVLGWIAGFLGPLIIYLTSENAEVKKHAKVVLNWQFSMIVYMSAAAILMFTIILIPLSVITFVALFILNIVFPIIAIVKASEGKVWKYPLSIPFFKV
jgi:uncharacterized protein